MKLERYKDYDWILIVTVLLLSVFGLIMVYSASFPLGLDLYDDPAYFFKNHLVRLILGLLLFFIVMHIPYNFYQKITPFIIVTSIILLIATLIFGREVNGSKNWLYIGPIGIQPSEFVKVCIIIYLAQVYSQKQKYINQFIKGVIPPLVIVVVMFTLIILQGDLGSAAVILAGAVMIVFLSGARIRHLLVLALMSSAVISYLAMIEPYRVRRLVAFRDPFEFASEAGGYQLIQSYIAIANGGWSGTGLGKSVQKMHFLPEPHTDFILSVIAEELGMIGIGFIILCLVVMTFRCVLIGTRCRTAFGSLLVFGIIFQMMVQAGVNAGAMSGLLPITGVTLPFVSYGGSSLWVSLISIAIVLNVSKENNKRQRENQSEAA